MDVDQVMQSSDISEIKFLEADEVSLFPMLKASRKKQVILASNAITN